MAVQEETFAIIVEVLPLFESGVSIIAVEFLGTLPKVLYSAYA